MVSTDSRRRSKRAYELGRLQLGLVAAWPVIPLTVLSAVVCGHITTALSIGALLVVVAVVFRARGQAYGRALVPGLVAGAAPLVLPLVLRTAGHCCVGNACWPVCMLGCIVGGFLAGLSLGVTAAAESDHRGAFMLASTLVAGLVGMLGCAISGFSGVVGMAVAMLATSLPVSLVVRARD